MARNRSSATGWGWLFWIDRFRRRSALSRASSEAGSSGFRATSATSATMSAACSPSTSPPIVVWSYPAVTDRSPPMPAVSSATLAEEIVLVPSCIRSAVSCESHTWSGRSFTRPARTARTTAALGTVPNGTRVTAMPFGNEISCRGGSFRSLGVPTGGGSCFWARAGAAAVTARMTGTVALIIVGMACSPRSVGGAGGSGAGRNLLSRNDGEDGSVGWREILSRRCHQQLGCHLGKLRLQPIDSARIVIEQREGGQQIGPAEAGERFDLGIEAGAQLHQCPRQLVLRDRSVP